MEDSLANAATIGMLALLFEVVFDIACICLQVFLSKKENKYLGLIMPGLILLFSLLVSLQAILGIGMIGWELSLMLGIMTFVGYNIPNVLFLAIYFYCQNKIKKSKRLEKMVLQDL